MSAVAKIFKSGRSQAVRLPAEFRFAESQVYVRRDPANGDVILSKRPDSWDGFFELLARVDLPQDFLADRGDAPPQQRPEL